MSVKRKKREKQKKQRERRKNARRQGLEWVEEGTSRNKTYGETSFGVLSVGLQIELILLGRETHGEVKDLPKELQEELIMKCKSQIEERVCIIRMMGEITESKSRGILSDADKQEAIQVLITEDTTLDDYGIEIAKGITNVDENLKVYINWVTRKIQIER